MKMKKIQRGFTLIELMLALGVAILVAVAALQSIKRNQDYDTAASAATQMLELNSALQKYIDAKYIDLSAAATTTVTIDNLKAAGLLPAIYNNRTPFGGTITMVVSSTGGTNPTPSGLTTTSAWLDGTTPRYDLLGAAIRKIGAQGGMTMTTNQVQGLNGGWALPKTQFTNITTPGQLAVRTYSTSSQYDDIYLRRDGSLPMIGNLDMGFHDINNAVNISSTGWIYANHLAANDATVGSLFTNYIRNTGGIDTSGITGVGNNSVSNFAAMKTNTLSSRDVGKAIDITGNGGSGRGVLSVNDIYLKDNRGVSTYLSDRLPRFVFKGAYLVTGRPDVGEDGYIAGSLPFPIIDKPTAHGDANYRCEQAQAASAATDSSGAALTNKRTDGGTYSAKARIILTPAESVVNTDVDYTGTKFDGTDISLVVKPNPTLVLTAEDYLDNTWKINLSKYKDKDGKWHYGSALASVYCEFAPYNN